MGKASATKWLNKWKPAAGWAWHLLHNGGRGGNDYIANGAVPAFCDGRVTVKMHQGDAGNVLELFNEDSDITIVYEHLTNYTVSNHVEVKNGETIGHCSISPRYLHVHGLRKGKRITITKALKLIG